MVYSKSLTVAVAALALAFPPMAAQARGTDNQTKATLAGAAVGAALGGIIGNDSQSVLIGAAAGGLAGNAYAYHNKKMNQRDAENRSYRVYPVAGKERYADHRAHKKYKKHKKHAHKKRAYRYAD